MQSLHGQLNGISPIGHTNAVFYSNVLRKSILEFLYLRSKYQPTTIYDLFQGGKDVILISSDTLGKIIYLHSLPHNPKLLKFFPIVNS